MGCGFWSRFQVAGWKELEGVDIAAAYNRTVSKAEKLAQEFGIPHVYGDAEELLRKEDIHVVDVITDVDTHAQFVELAARYGKAVICQKPMAPNLETARRMVAACRDAGVPFYVNENFRWQAPIRRLKAIIESGEIGEPFNARVTFCSGFPVFDNQPFLAELEQFILTDIGSHILDVSRFLMGDVEVLYCQTKRVNPKIKGEDVANVLMRMKNGRHCFVEMSYASILETEVFPQTLALIEGSEGSVQLKPGFILTITNRKRTRAETASPKVYPWVDPAYAVVHSSIVDAQRNILAGLRGETGAETTGEDNLKTVELVFGAYESAAKRLAVFV